MKISLGKRNAQILQGLIFWGLVVLIALTAIPYGTADAPWESIFEAAVFGLTMLWIVEGSLTGSYWVREHRLLLPLFALVVFALIQSLTLGNAVVPSVGGGSVNRALSADPFETWRFALKLLALTLTFGILLRFTSSVERLQILVWVVVGVALASAVFGLLRPEIPRHWLDFTGTHLQADDSYGQFDNRNHFALLMEMGIGLVLGLVAQNRASFKRLILFLFLGSILWIALLQTHSRGGVLGLLVEIPVFFVIYSTFSNRLDKLTVVRSKALMPKFVATIGLTAILLSAVAATVLVIGGDETVNRLAKTPAEFAAVRVGPPKLRRLEIWMATLKLIKDHPFLGVGFAGYSVAIPRYLNSSGEWTPQQAHNEYLEVLASGGAVGGALFGWFAVLLLGGMRKGIAFDFLAPMALRCGALASLVAIAAHSFLDFGLHITVNALLCCVLLVIAIKGNDTLGREAAIA